MMLLSFWRSTFSGPFLERRLMKSPLASGSSYKMSVKYKLSQNNGWVDLASLDRMLNKDIIYFVNEMFEMESYEANFQLPDLCLCFLQPSVGHQLTASGCVVIHYRVHDNCALSRGEREEWCWCSSYWNRWSCWLGYGVTHLKLRPSRPFKHSWD